jgi:5'-nucleotidase
LDGTGRPQAHDAAGQKQETDACATLRADPLRIGISTRALFDLEEEHRIFEDKGVQAYASLQLDRENAVIGKGTGFDVVERLLALNEADLPPVRRSRSAVAELPGSLLEGV